MKASANGRLSFVRMGRGSRGGGDPSRKRTLSLSLVASLLVIVRSNGLSCSSPSPPVLSVTVCSSLRELSFFSCFFFLSGLYSLMTRSVGFLTLPLGRLVVLVTPLAGHSLIFITLSKYTLWNFNLFGSAVPSFFTGCGSNWWTLSFLGIVPWAALLLAMAGCHPNTSTQSVPRMYAEEITSGELCARSTRV